MATWCLRGQFVVFSPQPGLAAAWSVTVSAWRPLFLHLPLWQLHVPRHGPNLPPLRPQLGLGRGHGGEEPPVELLLLWAGLWQFFKQTNLSLVA